MSFLHFLQNRHSNGLLQSPAPSDDEIKLILSAAMSVPDHGCLQPYHFTVIQNDGLTKLTDVFVEATKTITTDCAKLQKAEKMAYRAPLIIAISTRYKEHPKVPQNEQLITAGCAVYTMQMACVALGFQGMWRTGDLCYSETVKQALNVPLTDDIVGFLYIGTPSKLLANKKRKSCDAFVTYWQ